MTKKQTKKPATKAAKKAKAKDPIPGPGEIVVRDSGGAQVIAAERLADYFAIHPTSPSAKTYSVTHVPTGYKCGGPYRNRTIARFVALELRALGGDELWQFTKPDHLTKTQPADRIAAIRDLTNPATVDERLRTKAQAAPPTSEPSALTWMDDGTACRREGEKHALVDWANAHLVPKGINFTIGPVKRANGTATDQSWRSKIDWVAAGKKAHESRLRNAALREAAAREAAATTVAPGKSKKSAAAASARA